VINDCFGGYGLSDDALEEYKRMACIEDEEFTDQDIDRDADKLSPFPLGSPCTLSRRTHYSTQARSTLTQTNPSPLTI
jgi:hypothetical protein